jgi:hypothetical protein
VVAFAQDAYFSVSGVLKLGKGTVEYRSAVDEPSKEK